MKKHAKRIVALGLACMMTLSAGVLPEWTGGVTAYAESDEDSQVNIVERGTCGDNLTWTLNSDGLLTISGTGKMSDYVNNRKDRKDTSPWVDYKLQIVAVIINEGVGSIGSWAFGDCGSLGSIVIPNSVTSIGRQSFVRCTSITSIVLPDSVTSIGDNAFANCSSLSSITLPDSLTSIGVNVFINNGLSNVIYRGNCEQTKWNEIKHRYRDDIQVTFNGGHSYPENPRAADWQKNDSDHWLMCNREGCADPSGSIKNKAEHTYVGDICSVCGHKRDHEHYGFNQVDAKEATCKEAGHDAYYTCSGCDALFKDGVGAFVVSFADLTIPATGHKYEGNTCTVCGYQKPETNTSTTRSSGGSHHDSAEVTDNSQKGRWVQDEKGWYFRRNDGSYPKSGWSKLKWLGKEYWYYFDENGYMKLGWLDVNGSRYYMNPVIGTNSGKMLTGWQQIENQWYYFSTETGAKEGSLLRNTVTPDNYHVDENGIWQQ